MYQAVVLNLFALLPLGWAMQPGAPKPIPAPLRELKFGQLNFLHTTDTHGWHAGHYLEPSFAADWGDYIDFSDRLREKIEADGNDLLIIDSGDRVEGNGLYDVSEPKGKYTFPIFTQQRMDVICTGNHELYQRDASENDYNILAPAYHSSYITSNIDIVDPITGGNVSLGGQKFKKFTTKNLGLRVVAFGFIFNFDRANSRINITMVEKVVNQTWFQGVIRDPEVDVFVVTGHVQTRGPEFKAIYDAIRAVNKDVPIHFFGGHLHVRDYKKFDDKAVVLASGRYMETIGFASIDGLKATKNKNLTTPPTFFRRYIDNNLYSLYNHSKTNSTTFHTPKGRAVTQQITASRHALRLDELYGCSPTDLWLSRVKYPHPASIYSWLNDSVFPAAAVEPTRKDRSRLVMANTGSIRYDIFKGGFTRDWTSIISPFPSGMQYIKDVPAAQALRVRDKLNSGGPIFPLDNPHSALPLHELLPQEFQNLTDTRRRDALRGSLTAPSPSTSVVPGPVTLDDLGADGDDTVHTPIPTFWPPQVVQSYMPTTPSPDKVDFVFNAFLQPFVLAALKDLGLVYTGKDVAAYLVGETMTDVIVRWIKGNWGTECAGGEGQDVGLGDGEL